MGTLYIHTLSLYNFNVFTISTTIMTEPLSHNHNCEEHVLQNVHILLMEHKLTAERVIINNILRNSS